LSINRSPTIAIVIPLLNEVRALPRLISAMAGIGADEVVFVDGGSSDGSQALLQERDVRWYESMPGRARQMNLGSENIESDIIIFLHVDTIISSGNLESIRRHPEIWGMVAGRFNITLSGSHPMFRVIEFMINWRSRIMRISSGDQAMFVQRRIFRRLGGFPDQPLMEDIELSRRLKREGKILTLTDRVITSSRRWERFGILPTILLMWRLRFRYWLGADPVRLKALYPDCS